MAINMVYNLTPLKLHTSLLAKLQVVLVVLASLWIHHRGDSYNVIHGCISQESVGPGTADAVRSYSLRAETARELFHALFGLLPPGLQRALGHHRIPLK